MTPNTTDLRFEALLDWAAIRHTASQELLQQATDIWYTLSDNERRDTITFWDRQRWPESQKGCALAHYVVSLAV